MQLAHRPYAFVPPVLTKTLVRLTAPSSNVQTPEDMDPVVETEPPPSVIAPDEAAMTDTAPPPVVEMAVPCWVVIVAPSPYDTRP